MRAIQIAAAGLFALGAFAGGEQTLQVKVTAYRVIPVERTTYFSRPGNSQTSCYGSGTTFGLQTDLNMQCSTVTTPPQQMPVTVRKIIVYNQLESNGTRYIITCTAHWVGSGCTWLIPGDVFEANLRGTEMWISARKGGNMGKPARIKFKLLDMRPAQ